MAMSGRKIRRFRDSLSIGSTEDFDVCCDPCKFLGKTVEAKGFCENCQENLCKRCVDYHKSTKASRHHHLLDQPHKVIGGTTDASDDSKICTEYCHTHKKEVIKFFCSQHGKVGCSDCMTLEHRTCNIDYIPDVCSGILKSKEFSGTLQNVLKRLKETEAIKKNAHSKKTEIKTSVAAGIKEIEKFQKKMNDRIEQLKQQLVTEANLHMLKHDQEVDKISDLCARVYSELKQIHTALTDSQTKQLDAQAFVTMKRAQWILRSTNVQAYEEDLTNVLTTILFEPKKELENILFQQHGMGKFVLQLTNVVKKDKPKVGTGKSTEACVTVTQESTTFLQCIKEKKTMNVRTESDYSTTCSITGCAVISPGRLLLADFMYRNRKLKILNIDTLSVVEEMAVNNAPYDVTVLPRDEVAVTVPNEKTILIVGTVSRLTKIRNMKVLRSGYGITYHQDHLYVICREPNSLLVLDMLGNVQRDIPLQKAQDQMFSKPLYIAAGKDGHTLYISDWKSRFIASLTLQGKVTGVYTDNGLKEPCGLVVLEDGSLLVCCTSSGTIHHISADLKQGRTLIRDIPKVRSICCDTDSRQISVGAFMNDLSIFNYE